MALLVSGQAKGDDEKVTIVKQWEGQYSAATEPRSAVVRDQDGWEKVWKEAHKGSSPAPALPKVDFSKHMVLAVFAGPKKTGGYAVKVSELRGGSDELVAVISESRPAPKSVAAQVITSPVALALVPRADKVSFVDK
jgi:hypothetical protein